MTLDTRMYVLDEVPVAELFRQCQTFLGEYDEDKRGPEQQQSRNEQDKTWRKGESFVEPGNPWTMANRIGQNLPGILDISYRPDCPLRTAAQAASHSVYEYCNHPDNGTWFDDSEPVCDRSEHSPACWVEVSFDTAYGYRGPDGMGCGDLHALLVSRVGQWLDARGIRWSWKNEFTGEIHTGYDRLIDIASGGFEATAWFRTTVVPAIAAGLLEGER